MKDDKIVLYMHAGSGNHGCEAIVNSLCRMLPKPAILMTNRPKEDETYSLKELCSSFVQEKSIEKNVFVHTWYYLKRKLYMTRTASWNTGIRTFAGKICTV